VQKEVTVTDPGCCRIDGRRLLGAARLLYECNNGAGLRAKQTGLRAASGPSFGGGLGRRVDSHCGGTGGVGGTRTRTREVVGQKQFRGVATKKEGRAPDNHSSTAGVVLGELQLAGEVKWSALGFEGTFMPLAWRTRGVEGWLASGWILAWGAVWGSIPGSHEM
jgi:hypothetical protein